MQGAKHRLRHWFCFSYPWRSPDYEVFREVDDTAIFKGRDYSRGGGGAGAGAGPASSQATATPPGLHFPAGPSPQQIQQVLAAFEQHRKDVKHDLEDKVVHISSLLDRVSFLERKVRELERRSQPGPPQDPPRASPPPPATPPPSSGPQPGADGATGMMQMLISDHADQRPRDADLHQQAGAHGATEVQGDADGANEVQGGADGATEVQGRDADGATAVQDDVAKGSSDGSFVIDD